MRVVALLLLCIASTAGAITVRHDVDDAKYLLPESEFPALVDLAHEGHGVLIAPRWIVTAAHSAQWHPVTEVMLNGTCVEVERVVVHPGYKPLPTELQSAGAGSVMAFLATSDDVALIELAEPVTDVAPAIIYRGSRELDGHIKVIGKGGTGTGLDGQLPGSGNRTALRRAFNTVSAVDERWLSYVFDPPPAALALEGMSGNGDSGGPVLLHQDGTWQLAGLASWKYQDHDLSDFRPSVYGQTSKNVRLSRYADWIDRVIRDGSAADGSASPDRKAALRKRECTCPAP